MFISSESNIEDVSMYSTKYVPWKDIKAVMADLKNVFGASSLEDAEYRLEEFRDK